MCNNNSHDPSAPILTQRCVKHGCHLRPGLFNAILQFVMERWEQQIHDLGIGPSIYDSHLSNLRLAHDILLLATSQDDAICMLEILDKEFADVCFMFNTKKIKVLTT